MRSFLSGFIAATLVLVGILVPGMVERLIVDFLRMFRHKIAHDTGSSLVVRRGMVALRNGQRG